MEFLNKWYFVLLLIIPLVIYLYYLKQRKSWMKFRFIDDIQSVFWKFNYFFWIKIWILSSILWIFVSILANPNRIDVSTNIDKKWIDVVFTLDTSDSMNAEDLVPTRIKAAKKIISEFVSKLKNDRVWLVVFAWKPFVSLPLTFDYNVVKQTLSTITTSTLNKQAWLGGTAIWDGLLMAQTLFRPPAWMSKKAYKKREKVVILLTDGDANRWVNPVIAWEYLKKYWIKIYAIWIGSMKWWYITYKDWPFTQRWRVPPLKEWALREIAKITDWKFYRATDTQSLHNIFKDLKKLTKTNIKVKVKKVYTPKYMVFVYILIALMWIYIYLKLREID